MSLLSMKRLIGKKNNSRKTINKYRKVKRIINTAKIFNRKKEMKLMMCWKMKGTCKSIKRKLVTEGLSICQEFLHI